MPRLACIRPNSSKVVEFISSWMAFGCERHASSCWLGAFSVLKPKVRGVVDADEAVADWSVLPGALQLLLAAKLVP